MRINSSQGSLTFIIAQPQLFVRDDDSCFASETSAQKARMGNLQNTLNKLNSSITGSLGIALVDHESGMALATVGTGINLEVAAAGNMEVVRAELRVVDNLDLNCEIEDMLITLADQYHIIRPIGSTLFLYVALNRKIGNLALARHTISESAKSIRI